MTEQKKEGIVFTLPTKAPLTKRVRVYVLGGSHAVLIPKVWLDIFQCEDDKGKYWVERDIVGDTITIKPASLEE